MGRNGGWDATLVGTRWQPDDAGPNWIDSNDGALPMKMWRQHLDPGATISLPATSTAVVMGIVVRKATDEETDTLLGSTGGDVECIEAVTCTIEDSACTSDTAQVCRR